MQVSRSFRSQIIERLEREKKKITEEVEALKQKRGNTPITPRVIGQPGSSVMKKTPGSHMNLYRTVMAVREANKISHHLKKDTVSTTLFCDSAVRYEHFSLLFTGVQPKPN